jgi:hypothetical protein
MLSEMQEFSIMWIIALFPGRTPYWNVTTVFKKFASSIFSDLDHGKLKIVYKNITGHYVNVTEHGLAHDWEKVQR